MMPAAYYRDLRIIRRGLEICLKCGKADAEFPYTCCTKCRARQIKMDHACTETLSEAEKAN
jgi:hypothetical protein